jgi:hypothetical protein
MTDYGVIFWLLTVVATDSYNNYVTFKVDRYYTQAACERFASTALKPGTTWHCEPHKPPPIKCDPAVS